MSFIQRIKILEKYYISNVFNPISIQLKNKLGERLSSSNNLCEIVDKIITNDEKIITLQNKQHELFKEITGKVNNETFLL